MITLSDAERDRFVEYLRQEAVSHHDLAETMSANGMPASVAQHRRALAAAHKTVANYLGGIESMSVR